MRWERRILQSNATIQEIVILNGLLSLLWSGLRFGDIQPSCLTTWQLDSAALRGLTWRSKTSNSATPFSICVCDLLSKGTLAWIHRYLQTLDTLYSQLNSSDVDFCHPQFWWHKFYQWPPQAMAYGEALLFETLHDFAMELSIGYSTIIIRPLYDPWSQMHTAQLGMPTGLVRGRPPNTANTKGHNLLLCIPG